MMILQLALLALPAPAFAQETSIYSYIQDALRTRPHTRAEVETLIGGPLTEKNRGVFTSYEGEARRTTDGILTTVDFREPATASATAGAILILNFGGPCIPQAEVAHRYPEINESYSPNHRNPESLGYWGRKTDWGRYSFGFGDPQPFCLRSFVIALDKPPPG